MTAHSLPQSRVLPVLCGLILCVSTPQCSAQGPSPSAISAFDSYARAIESRLATQHRSRPDFMAVAANTSRNQLHLRKGEFVIEQLTPPSGLTLPGALLHHWRGTAFIPGATAASFTSLLKNYTAYPRYFMPQILHAKVLSQHGNQFQVEMRFRQHHIITVVLDATYNVTFDQLDPYHHYSISRSVQISEVEDPGANSEHILDPAQSHGFLWRQNTYWTYEQCRDGLYVQIESISLTRSIPFGLGWAVGPYVESIPRDSLEFTLRAVVSALQPHKRTHV